MPGVCIESHKGIGSIMLALTNRTHFLFYAACKSSAVFWGRLSGWITDYAILPYSAKWELCNRSAINILPQGDLFAERDRCAVNQKFGGTAYNTRRHIANIDYGVRSELCGLRDHPINSGCASPSHHLCVFSQLAAKDKSDYGG